jgi:glycosyltransferase involved in cell wall biosynthesis
MSATPHEGCASARQPGAPRVALVHDWLDTWRGGENVLGELVRIYPQAQLYALVDFLPDALRPRLSGKRAKTSFLQRLPGARRHFRALLPLFPRAIESLDVAAFDLVISSSHAVAKGVRTSGAQLHLCYCHTPMRYAWDLREQYLEASGLSAGLRGGAARRVLDRLREWDRAASARVNHFVANSSFIRDRIARCYGRSSTVIYPPVDVDFFTPPATASAPVMRDYYFAASQWVPYKRIDLIVAAFRALPDHRLIVAGEGADAQRVRAAKGPNTEIVGHVSRERLRDLMRNARALVFAAEEDFGILPVEAQACGTPVIAFGHGGARETVRSLGEDRPTGLFFEAQSAAAIAEAVARFDAMRADIDPADCRSNAERFSAQRFRREFEEFAQRAWRGFAAAAR